MSAKVDQFCDSLHDRLRTIEGWLESVVKHMQSLPEKVRKDLEDKLQKAHSKLQAQKESIEQTRADLKSQPQQKPEIPEAATTWKAKPEVQAASAGADATGAHAAATIDHAVASIDEVSDAMLYAAVARLHTTAR